MDSINRDIATNFKNKDCHFYFNYTFPISSIFRLRSINMQLLFLYKFYTLVSTDL